MLAMSSLDRYTTGIPNSIVRKDSALINLYSGVGQRGNDFQLSSPGAFIYGYITRIAISQIQIEYRIPTVVPTNRIFFAGANNPSEPVCIGNDTFVINVPNNPPGARFQRVTIPYGFYTPKELAVMLQATLREYMGLETMTVSYSQAYLPPVNANPFSGYGGGNSFIFETDAGHPFAFPSATVLQQTYDTEQVIAILKTYRLLGIEQNINELHPAANFYQTQSPNFLYTPYIDIVSNNLTKFQKVKDSDTSVYGRTGLIARCFLSSVGGPQPTSLDYSLGSQPFIITADLNTPKVIRWNKDETVYNLDFQLYDQYGDLMFWNYNYPTEFQMALLCMEDTKDNQ
jgi:hypothetical protein